MSFSIANAGCTTSAVGQSNVYNTIREPRELWVAMTLSF